MSERKYAWINSYPYPYYDAHVIVAYESKSKAIESRYFKCIGTHRYYQDEHGVLIHDPEPEPEPPARVDCERWIVVRDDGRWESFDVGFSSTDSDRDFVTEAEAESNAKQWAIEIKARAARVHVREIIEGEPTYEGLRNQLAMMTDLRNAEADRCDKLIAAIRASRDRKGHDRCWWDTELYSHLPEGVKGSDLQLPPRDEFLAECAKYWDSTAKGGDYNPPSTTTAICNVDWREVARLHQTTIGKFTVICKVCSGHGTVGVRGDEEMCQACQGWCRISREQAAMLDPRWGEHWRITRYTAGDKWRFSVYVVDIIGAAVATGDTISEACEAALATVKP